MRGNSECSGLISTLSSMRATTLGTSSKSDRRDVCQEFAVGLRDRGSRCVPSWQVCRVEQFVAHAIGYGDLDELLVAGKLAGAICDDLQHRGRVVLGSVDQRSVLGVPSAGCQTGAGRVENGIGAVWITDAKRSQDAVQPPRRHAPVPYFKRPRMPSTGGRPNSLAMTTSIGRRSSNIMCGSNSHRRAASSLFHTSLANAQTEATRATRPLSSVSAAACAARGGEPMWRVAPGDRRSRCHPGRPPGRPGPAQRGAGPFPRHS